MNYSLAIHGGAGTILKSDMTQDKQSLYNKALLNALHAGESRLRSGGSAVEAVEAAVIVMEDFPLFNAGKGSVFNDDGGHEMEAVIMCGKTLNAGGGVSLYSVRNPIHLARKVLESSEHVLLAGSGALDFAREHNVELVDELYFYTAFRFEQWQYALKADLVQLDHAVNKKGTVGAVALDSHGNLAAATSTGGMTNKKYGRIGDSPLIGCGTYANNATCAVSCTGYGEFYIRGVVAYDVSCLMAYKGLSLEEACKIVIFDKQPKLGGDGGLVAVDSKGNVALPFNSEGMYRAYVRSGEKPITAIFEDSIE